MKSFFQLSEQVSRYRKKKLMEADAPTANQPPVKEAEPAQAAANQQMQNNQNNQQATSASEQPEVDVVTDFQKKFKDLVQDKTNAASLVRMKEIPATQDFSTQLTNALAELEKAVAAMQKQDKEEKSGEKMNPAAGSNETGSSAGGTPPATVTPAAPPTQAPPA